MKATQIPDTHAYKLPTYALVPGVGLKEVTDHFTTNLQFVKGKSNSPEHIGIISEDLIDVMVHHLGEINVGELQNTFTTNAIESLKSAKQSLIDRKSDREKRGVLHTNEK